jgi:MFS family permease
MLTLRMTMRTPSRTSSDASPARLSFLWLGVQLIWGAVLGISLQARSAQLAGDASLATFGAIATGGALVAALTQLLVGPLSDRARRMGAGRSVFYVAGALLGAPAIVALYLAPDVRALALAFIVLQFALNVVTGPYQAILPDTLPPARFGIGSAWMAAMGSAGNACGAILATLLGNPLALGVVLALGLLAGSAVTLVHLRSVPLRALPPNEPVAITRTLVDLFVSRAFVYLGFYTMLGYLYFFIASILPVGFALDAKHASGLCILLFTLVGSLGAVLAARPSDRIDERVVVTAGGGLVAVALIALALAHVPIALPIAIAAAGVGWGIFLCADWAFACRLLPPAALATTMAGWNLAVVGPQMLAPAIVGTLLASLRVIRTTAGPRDALLIAGAEMLIGTAWIWRLPSRLRGK